MLLSTHAIEGSDAPAPAGARAALWLRYADLVLLALALPVFVLAGLPLVGYTVAAIAWLAQHAILAAADRGASAALARGDRRRALGTIGVATLGRVWLVTLSILLVGLLGDREDGLAAAVLSLFLVSFHLGGMAISKLFEPQADR